MLVILLTLLSPVNCDTVDYMGLYRQTLTKFHKLAPSAPASRMHRPNAGPDEHFVAFKKTVDAVTAHNAAAHPDWHATINKFALETDSERQAQLGLKMNMSELTGMRRSPISQLLFKRAPLPDSVDYQHKLAPPRDQGGCGSCWAFAAVSALEYQVNKQRPEGARWKSLSEQEYLDCVYRGNGCDGGWPGDCYVYTSNNDNHIAYNSDYPYRATGGLDCESEKHKTAIKGWNVNSRSVYLKGDREMKIAAAIPDIGVFVAAMAVIADFYTYDMGVYSSDVCADGKAPLNHAVAVVGYGVEKSTGHHYWKVRNSWGPEWGINGYFLLKRASDAQGNLNMCQISSYPHYPVVTGADEEEEGEGGAGGGGGGDGNGSGSMWCVHQDKELKGYTTGTRVAMRTLAQAKSACGATHDCYGVTTEGTDVFTLRSGEVLEDRQGAVTYVPGTCRAVCTWEKVDNRRFKGKLGKVKMTFTNAKEACEENTKCKAVVCKSAPYFQSAKRCVLVSTTKGKKAKKYDSFIKRCQ